MVSVKRKEKNKGEKGRKSAGPCFYDYYLKDGLSDLRQGGEGEDAPEPRVLAGP
jgi:hypothetical protein